MSSVREDDDSFDAQHFYDIPAYEPPTQENQKIAGAGGKDD